MSIYHWTDKMDKLYMIIFIHIGLWLSTNNKDIYKIRIFYKTQNLIVEWYHTAS